MKAEERHQLQENDLAKALGLVKTVNRKRVAIWAGLAALVFGVVFYIRWYSHLSANEDAARWVSVQAATDKETLKGLMDTLRGKEPGAVAKMKYARILLGTEGLNKLATTDSAGRLAAANSVDEAKKMFLELTKELGTNQMLVQECWLDAAKAEEALIAVPKSAKDDSSRGNIDESIKYLQNAAKIAPASEASKRIAEQIEKAEKNKAETVAFYVALQKSLYVTQIPEMDVPEMGPKSSTGTVPSPPVPPVDTKAPDLKAPEAPKADAKPKDQPGVLKGEPAKDKADAVDKKEPEKK